MIDRELLWKAWPEGYLAMRGVSTVGDFHCVWLGDKANSAWVWRASDVHWFPVNNEGEDAAYIAGRVKAGDLLPNVDPADVATWACCKADLAQALGVPDRSDEPNTAHVWTRDEHNWTLTTFSAGGRHIAATIAATDTDDPAEALVRARIQTREETDP